MLSRATGRAARPEKTDGSARSSWGLAPRKRRSHQGLRRCMYPRGRLPRKSRQMEHNQGCSPFYFSFQFSVFSFQFSVFSFQFSVVSCQLSVVSCQPASAAYFSHSPHLPGLLLWVANSADVQSNPHVGQRVFSTVLWKKTRQLRATAGVMQGCGVCPRSWHSQGTGKQEFSKGGAADRQRRMMWYKAVWRNKAAMAGRAWWRGCAGWRFARRGRQAGKRTRRDGGN